MSGTETQKTANLLTADGTFKKFTFPVERQFDLFEMGEQQKNLGHFVHKARDCAGSRYQYFPQLATLLSLDDAEHKIQNLTLRKSYRMDGDFLSLGQRDSRYCLVKDFHANRMFEVDKLTGHSVKLTRASHDFIGDTWHVDLCVSGDGSRITRAEGDFARKTITVSAWDVQKEVLLVKPFTVSYTNEFREPEVMLCEADNDTVLLVVSGRDGFAKETKISIKAFTPDGLSVRHDFLVPLNGFNCQAYRENQKDVTILFNDSKDVVHYQYRWGLKRYDLTTGNCVYTNTIESPGDVLRR